MANNRMFLTCKHCGEKFCLGKYYPISWTSRINVIDFNDWLEKHDRHSSDRYDGDLGMGANFYELTYETSD
jgi:hypothetical protein